AQRGSGRLDPGEGDEVAVQHQRGDRCKDPLGVGVDHPGRPAAGHVRRLPHRCDRVPALVSRPGWTLMRRTTKERSLCRTGSAYGDSDDWNANGKSLLCDPGLSGYARTGSSISTEPWVTQEGLSVGIPVIRIAVCRTGST